MAAIKCAPDVASSLVFKPDSGDVFTLNSTGALVWELYSKDLAADTVASRLVKRYGISHDQARHDVFAFVAEVRRHGLEIRA
ncbi:MAG: PqqD family protein [Candidatus Methylomirabilia bacterium]